MDEMYEQDVEDQESPIVALEPGERSALLDHVDDECTFRVRWTVHSLMRLGLRQQELAHMDSAWLDHHDGHDPTSEDFNWDALVAADDFPVVRVPRRKPCDCDYCRTQAARKVARNSNDPDEGEPGFDDAVAADLAERWRPKSARGSRTVPVYFEDTWRVIWRFFYGVDPRGEPYAEPYVPPGESEPAIDDRGDVVMQVPVTGYAIWARLDRLSPDLPFENKLTCNTMRHTFCTMFAEQEAPVDTIRRLAGHRSSETTDVYIDLAGRQIVRQGSQYVPET